VSAVHRGMARVFRKDILRVAARLTLFAYLSLFPPSPSPFSLSEETVKTAGKTGTGPVVRRSAAITRSLVQSLFLLDSLDKKSKGDLHANAMDGMECGVAMAVAPFALQIGRKETAQGIERAKLLTLQSKSIWAAWRGGDRKSRSSRETAQTTHRPRNTALNLQVGGVELRRTAETEGWESCRAAARRALARGAEVASGAQCVTRKCVVTERPSNDSSSRTASWALARRVGDPHPNPFFHKNTSSAHSGGARSFFFIRNPIPYQPKTTPTNTRRPSHQGITPAVGNLA
jgi:hypothetical protein